MAIIQREIRKRGFFGVVFKWLFIVFNVLMLIWLINYWMAASDMMKDMTSDAEQAGGAIGATMATGMIVFFWVAGAVILGLLTMMTRGRRILITEDKP